MGNCVSCGPSPSSKDTLSAELPVCDYHVFLSFRGPDVRRNFLDCFYDHLRGSGIVAFRDREEIKAGKTFNSKILEAIKRSVIGVPVFSKNFASSAACLMEVAQMVESGKPILPIFYGVKPSVVKQQKGKYKKAFIKHERREDAETIRKWKDALENIAEILGFEVEHVDSGYHDLLDNVVSRLQQLLRTDEQEVTENLVGIDRDVQEIMRKLGVDNQEGQVVQGQKTVGRCVVAIWGLPGVGKTTLAKEVYNKINHLFDSCSFLEDVRDGIEQNRMVYLQKKLIRDLKRGDCPEVKSESEGTKLIKFLFQTKRVLIVLDNVDDFKQIKPLAENLCWFGPGSRIILTSRRKEVTELCNNGQEIREHELLSMNENHAPNLKWIPPRLQLKELELSSFPLESLQTSVATVEHIIGIDDRVKEVIKLLEIEDEKVGVRMVGIYGTNGIGKTTIVKALYDGLSSYFDRCSFLAEIGETVQNVGIQFVQTKLISNILERDCNVASIQGGIKFFLDVFRSMKVLIVLDDVEDQSHLNDLVGDDLDWFGSGSRIIVTSENGEIFQRYDSQGLAHTYEVTEMDNDQALELFRKHALGTNDFIPGFPEIGSRIIKATGQVPFAIEVMGSLLRGKTIQDWWKMEDLMKQRKQNSQEILKDCTEILKICYEELDEKQKQIFWDIAWFANGVNGQIASYMWPDRDPSHCVLMPLAKIGGDNMLWMHKLLKHLSGTIDKEEYPGRRGRLYMHVSDLAVINRKEGMEEVEVLRFDFKNDCLLKETDFEGMPNVRFLQLDHARMSGNFANVFPKLRWLRWQGCPRDFEATEFNLTEAAILDLSWSKVTEDWGGWRKIKMGQLKVLNLTSCTDLLISPTFSSFPNLEILILERCSRLVHLDPSVGGLKKLLCLNLKSCTELNMLPAELVGLEALKELLIDDSSVQEIPLGGGLKKLETLCASNCLSFLPHSFEHLTSLSILSVDNSKITKLPDGVGELVKLRRLSMRNCRYMRELPESIGQLGRSLEQLDVSGTGVSKLPDSFGNLLSLRVLKMDYCFMREFPSFIGRLHSLEEIHASSCRSLKGEIPRDIGKLIHLRILRLQYSGICSLPSEIKHLSKLETLDLLHCDMLQELPELPSGLVIVRLSPKLKEKIV